MINKIKEMYKQQGISEQVYDFSEKTVLIWKKDLRK